MSEQMTGIIDMSANAATRHTPTTRRKTIYCSRCRRDQECDVTTKDVLGSPAYFGQCPGCDTSFVACPALSQHITKKIDEARERRLSRREARTLDDRMTGFYLWVVAGTVWAIVLGHVATSR